MGKTVRAVQLDYLFESFLFDEGTGTLVRLIVDKTEIAGKMDLPWAEITEFNFLKEKNIQIEFTEDVVYLTLLGKETPVNIERAHGDERSPSIPRCLSIANRWSSAQFFFS